ncbi:AAA family ATPase, partial [Candidatus Parcubacteria bacterium]
MLERILERQGCAPLGMWPENWEQLFEKFGARYPHMEGLVRVTRESCALASLMETRPVALGDLLLLVGPPGVGKTDAAMFLAEMVGVATRRIGCADVTNGFDMTGMSEGWAGAKPGHLAKMLILEDCANPLVVLDELDKVSLAGRASDSLEARLYSVLEPISAKSFRDEFLDVPLDIMAFNWIATANSIDSIPSPILDRFRVIQVRSPSREELRSLIPGIYRTIIENESWGEA